MTPEETNLVTSPAWDSLPPEERRRREQGATRLRDRLSQNPWYAEQARISGYEFWASLYDSRVNL